MQIGIEEITIDDNNGKVQVTLSSKIKKSLKKPLLEEYTIEYEGFKVDKEELKYTEGKEEKSLPLNKLMYKDNMDLSNYQFADDDKSELDKLVTIAIKDEEYNNLPKDIQEQLTKVAENNASLAKEFWDTIKSEEKIDELIKNDQDLQSKYDKFKEEKENRELITNQLTKACFDKDNQAKINQYISFIENNIKVKLDNNTTANQYLFDQLKGKENQSEIVQGVANLYEQVISGDNIKADIKQQLKSMIKSRFEELIKEDASYKENIEIKETDITIKDNGEVTVKLSSKIQNSLSKEYTITYKFFEVEAEDLKYTEDKNNGAQSLSLNKLMYQDGKDLSKYQFADKDKTELKKLVTDKKIVRDNIENVFKNYTIGDIKNYDKLKDEATKIQDLINNFLKYIAQGKDNNGKAIEAVTTSDDIYKLFNNDPKQGETDFKDAVNKWINQYIINQLKGKINNIQNDKTLQKNVGKKAIIFTNLMKINDLLQLNKLQIQNTGQTALKYLNDKFTNDFKTKYIGDTNSKIEFKNNGEIDNFVIGNAFETIDENTTNIKSNGADDKIKLEKIKQKLQTTLSSEFNKRLKVVKIESEGELKTIGKRFLEMLDNVNIEIPDTYNFEKALNDYNDTNQFVEGKKFTDLQDEDLNALVEPVLKSVFGDAAICKDVFDKLNAFNEEGNKVCNDGNNNENPTKTICEGSIATISGSSDGKKPEQRQAAQTHFTKTLGKALWNLRVALNDLYTTSGASNEWTTLLKKQIFGQLYFKINTDEGADDDESGTNIPCIAMKNTLLFKWLYVTKDTYAKNDDKKKNCVIKSIQRIIHMRFKNLTTKFHNGVNTTNAGTDFFTCNNNDINTIGLDEIGKAVQDFSNLTFVLPLSEQGISITDKAGSNAWDMDNVNFKVHKCGTKKIVENELIFVKDKECIEANYLLGMCGDWNGKVAKIEYYNSASKSKQQAKVTDTIKNN